MIINPIIMKRQTSGGSVISSGLALTLTLCHQTTSLRYLELMIILMMIFKLLAHSCFWQNLRAQQLQASSLRSVSVSWVALSSLFRPFSVHKCDVLSFLRYIWWSGPYKPYIFWKLIQSASNTQYLLYIFKSRVFKDIKYSISSQSFH